MTDRDTTTRTRARAPGVGGVFHRMTVHDRVLRPDSERTTVATTKCTKGGCKLDGGQRMPGAGLSRRSPRKAPLGQPAFQPYWGKLAVRNDRGDRGNVGIIRSPIRASILPDRSGRGAKKHDAVQQVVVRLAERDLWSVQPGSRSVRLDASELDHLAPLL